MSDLLQTVHFAIPGDLATLTGGYGYDRRVIAELPRLGWRVEHVRLPNGFPAPSRAQLQETRNALQMLPAGSLVLVDGLAFGVMAEIVQAVADRLRFVALVHHPLADETGLVAVEAERLVSSERAALGLAHQVVCTSNTTARRLKEAFGVDADRLTVALPGTERQTRASGQGDPPLIVCVAAVVPRKGHDVLLTALARLADLSWTCRIVGDLTRDPVWGREVRDMAERLGLAERVTFVGPTEDIASELRGADIFALPSRHEGYGMAFGEALAFGLPIVACDAGAVREVVPPDAGYLVAPDDIEAFAAALGRLISDGGERSLCADAAWRAGQALPSWRDTAAALSRVLDKARQ